MPQIILAIIIIYIAVWVLAAVFWVILWIAAAVFWFWQVFLMPFFLYFTPAVFTLIVVAAIFWGSWIAIQNYFLSLKTNINPAGLSEKLTRYYIISTLTLFLAIIYLSLILSSFVLIYPPSKQFVVHVVDHYESITFPAFRIYFPFWKT